MGGKSELNVGGLWRSAHALGAAFIFTIGRRHPWQRSDVSKAHRHIPLFEYIRFSDFLANAPKDCFLIGIETHPTARMLPEFRHPDRSIYLLGAEDSGIPSHALAQCHTVVQIPSQFCLNVATAGSIVLYDRLAKN